MRLVELKDNKVLREVKLTGKNSFLIHESQKQLPINRYTDFQKYVLQDVGIGSTIESVDSHYRMLDTFLTADQTEDARRERYNLHSNLYLLINRINIEHISFACLIHSVNGQVLEDFSETNLIRICEQLGKMGLTQQMVSDILNGVKKNLIQN